MLFQSLIFWARTRPWGRRVLQEDMPNYENVIRQIRSVLEFVNSYAVIFQNHTELDFGVKFVLGKNMHFLITCFDIRRTNRYLKHVSDKVLRVR